MMTPVTAVSASAPGRVNLIGEHLDYNHGRCLPIAIPRRTTVTAQASTDGQLSVTSGGLSWSGLPVERAEGWAAYVVGVLWALDVEVALELEISSDVPIGAGLSSSAALECATAVAVDALLDLGRTTRDLAEACIRAEREYVGAPTGGLDQTTSLFATAGQALLLDFADDSTTRVPWRPEDDGVTLLVVDTHVSHALAAGDESAGRYAERRADCERAAAELGLAHLAAAGEADVERVSAALRPRVRHVVSEQARVGALAAAARDRDWVAAGTLMSASHASLRDDFEVSCPELDVAVATALDVGALGARMTGGGFGGSAIVLVPADRGDAVRDAVAAAFARNDWDAPTCFEVEASRGAEVVTSARRS
jgi:galactokinase